MVEAVAGYVILYNEQVEANIPWGQGRQVPWTGDVKIKPPPATSPMCGTYANTTPLCLWPQSHTCAEG